MADILTQSSEGRSIRPRSVIAVVLNYNGSEDTIRCVNSLREVRYDELQMVIVDNASVDGSAEKLAHEFPEITILRQTVNGGYGAGNNAGIRWALQHDAEYILIVNNDVIVDKELLAPMVEAFERSEDVGVVTCKVLYQSRNDEIFSGPGSFNRWVCTGINRGGYLSRRKDTHRECEIDYVCGVLLLVRRDVFQTIGLFEEKFFMYFEDLEFSRRVLRRFKMIYMPNAVAYHRSGGGKNWSSYTELYLYYHTRNRILVFESDFFLYRIYVWFFTLAISLLKSLVLLRDADDVAHRKWRRLKALWNGFIDGTTGRSGIPMHRKFNN